MANGHAIIYSPRDRAAAWLVAYFLVALAGLAYSEPALAFPELARHGYAHQCSACHVSPTGGGALTTYGRTAGGDALPTWRNAYASRALYHFELPDWIAIGGDQRSVGVAVQAPKGSKTVYRFIPMQYDAELALSPTPYFTVAGAWGVYGPEFEEASRRHYALLRLGEHFTARVGRFFPAYGIMGPDHATFSKKALGFDQGKETVNGEMGVHGKWGDVFITSIYGEHASFEVEGPRDYDTNSDDYTGVAVRLQAAIGKTYVVGASCLYLTDYEGKRRACGAHAVVAPEFWIYGTAQVDRLVDQEDTVATTAVGVEPYRGFNFIYSYEHQDLAYRHGLTLQWVPFPHWEFSAGCKRETRAVGDFDSCTVMAHQHL